MQTRRQQIVTAGSVLSVSGLIAEVFRVTLVQDTIMSFANSLSPGVMYTFEIVQDGTGGHAFTWPAIVLNAPLVNPTPNSVTVANFVARRNGQLYGNLPPMYD